MKTSLLLLVALAILLTPAWGWALPDKIFTSSGQILPGEEWNSVYIYNDDTIVDMLGGFVEGMGTYDASRVNITAGHINTLDAWDFSSANVSAGEVFSLSAVDSGTVTLSGTGIVSAFSAGGEFTTANMYGGTAVYVHALMSGTVNLYGGLVSEYISAPEGTVNIFGYDLFKSPGGGAYGYGFVTGHWSDGTAFTIDLLSPETYSNVTLIPEPCSLMVFALGALLVRRKG